MKKITALIMALLLIAATFLFSACKTQNTNSDEESKQPLSPKEVYINAIRNSLKSNSGPNSDYYNLKGGITFETEYSSLSADFETDLDLKSLAADGSASLSVNEEKLPLDYILSAKEGLFFEIEGVTENTVGIEFKNELGSLLSDEEIEALKTITEKAPAVIEKMVFSIFDDLVTKSVTEEKGDIVILEEEFKNADIVKIKITDEMFDEFDDTLTEKLKSDEDYKALTEAIEKLDSDNSEDEDKENKDEADVDFNIKIAAVIINEEIVATTTDYDISLQDGNEHSKISVISDTTLNDVSTTVSLNDNGAETLKLTENYDVVDGIPTTEIVLTTISNETLTFDEPIEYSTKNDVVLIIKETEVGKKYEGQLEVKIQKTYDEETINQKIVLPYKAEKNDNTQKITINEIKIEQGVTVICPCEIEMVYSENETGFDFSGSANINIPDMYLNFSCSFNFAVTEIEAKEISAPEDYDDLNEKQKEIVSIIATEYEEIADFLGLTRYEEEQDYGFDVYTENALYEFYSNGTGHYLVDFEVIPIISSSNDKISFKLADGRTLELDFELLFYDYESEEGLVTINGNNFEYYEFTQGGLLCQYYYCIEEIDGFYEYNTIIIEFYPEVGSGTISVAFNYEIEEDGETFNLYYADGNSETRTIIYNEETDEYEIIN